jgi:hypothetical protein
MENRSMDWAHWSFSIKNEASAALITTASPAGPWVTGDFTQAGTFIRDKIHAAVLPYVYSAGMTMTGYGPVSGQYYAEAVILIRDQNGAAVPNVKVAGRWSGAAGDADAGLTGADGRLTVTSDRSTNGGTFTFTILNVVPSGKSWHPHYPGSVNTNAIKWP